MIVENLIKRQNCYLNLSGSPFIIPFSLILRV